MYCPAHKGARIRNLKGRTGGKTSKFTPTMLEELRDMYLKYPVGEIAEHFGIARGSVYRLNKYTPKNLRDE
jgi:transposase-like protein